MNSSSGDFGGASFSDQVWSSSVADNMITSHNFLQYQKNVESILAIEYSSLKTKKILGLPAFDGRGILVRILILLVK